MDTSKFLITGANGQLGLALRAKYPDAKTTDQTQMDITDSNAVSTFDWSNVTTILNAAAYTDVDGAETPEGRVAAWKINAQGPSNLAKIARERDILLIHLSSDYVFDGTQSPHLESEAPSPLSSYGASKAAGDMIVGVIPKYCLIRASWIIGEGKNFVRTMLELGKQGVAPTVVHDQIGRLTFTSELVNAIDHLLKTNAAYGTYNVSNEGDPCSWADITRTIFKEANYDLFVTNATTAEYFAGKNGVAVRPLNSVLDLSKIKSTGFNSRNWHDDLKQYIKKELGK
ncbi:MAG: dTDP-4-dehydrorhamnose reductase [Candidatus Saccharibacteria bacterium]|nr:dTDP-4-dehydrorhamnose reductase [Candidatus Saccharibacteria bacterium]